MSDLSIYETFNGGDVAIIGNDLVLVNSLWNQPYLALFGGSIRESTPADPEDIVNNLERFDHWANSLLHPDSPEIQFNSQLERDLESVGLNSAGLQELTQIVREDLSFLSGIADISVNVTLESVDKVKIAIRLQEPDRVPTEFIFLWNGTKLEEIIKIPRRDAVIAPFLVGDEGFILRSDDGDTILFGDD